MILHFLLYISLLPCVSANRHKISVLIFGSESFDEIVGKVKRVFIEEFGSLEYQLSNVTFEPEFVNAVQMRTHDETNQLELTGELICQRMINGSIAAVVYSDEDVRERQEYLSLVSTAAYALGLYKVPTVGVMVRDAEFGKKLVYPSFVRPTPSYSDEAHVFLHLLERLRYRQIVVVCAKGDKNSIDFVNHIRKKRKEFKIHVSCGNTALTESWPIVHYAPEPPNH